MLEAGSLLVVQVVCPVVLSYLAKSKVLLGLVLVVEVQPFAVAFSMVEFLL